MSDSDPRWMTWFGLVLILIPLTRSLIFLMSSFQVEQLLVETTNVRLVAHVSTILGILFLLPELRTRLVTIACLFLITMLPLQSGSINSNPLQNPPLPSSGTPELLIAMGVLVVGWVCMVYSVGGTARLYFIIGCLSSWIFAISTGAFILVVN